MNALVPSSFNPNITSSFIRCVLRFARVWKSGSTLSHAVCSLLYLLHRLVKIFPWFSALILLLRDPTAEQTCFVHLRCETLLYLTAHSCTHGTSGLETGYLVTVFLNPSIRRLRTVFWHYIFAIVSGPLAKRLHASLLYRLLHGVFHLILIELLFGISNLKSLYRRSFSRLMPIILRPSRSWITTTHSMSILFNFNNKFNKYTNNEWKSIYHFIFK